VLIAAKLIGETAGIARFRHEAQLARLAGSRPSTPPPGSSAATASTATATAS
jgi:hypothetical protein